MAAEDKKAADEYAAEEKKHESKTDDGTQDDAAGREPAKDDGLSIVGDDNQPREAEGAVTRVNAPPPAAAVQS
ncbi:hypothetical protein, partial [Streptomyces sp. DT9]